MIKKPTIIITSLGRTGTKFFYTLLKEVIPDCTALHEPNVFNIVQFDGTGERIRQLLRQIREAGPSNLIIKRALGRWSLIELSDARARGRLGHPEAVQRVLDQRKDFANSRPGSVYVEANIAYYGLVDVLKDVYEQLKVAYIVRDGRDWVRSQMSWGEMYGKGRIRSMFAHTWPTASEMENDPYKLRWGAMSRFERVCWAWTRLNAYALGTTQGNPNARVFRFEDIFQSEDRYQHLADLVQFVTTFPSVGSVVTAPLEGWLDRQIHKSSSQFPPWLEWSADQKRQFNAICDPLMSRLNYA